MDGLEVGFLEVVEDAFDSVAEFVVGFEWADVGDGFLEVGVGAFVGDSGEAEGLNGGVSFAGGEGLDGEPPEAVEVFEGVR